MNCQPLDQTTIIGSRGTGGIDSEATSETQMTIHKDTIDSSDLPKFITISQPSQKAGFYPPIQCGQTTINVANAPFSSINTQSSSLNSGFLEPISYDNANVNVVNDAPASSINTQLQTYLNSGFLVPISYDGADVNVVNALASSTNSQSQPSSLNFLLLVPISHGDDNVNVVNAPASSTNTQLQLQPSLNSFTANWDHTNAKAMPESRDENTTELPQPAMNLEREESTGNVFENDPIAEFFQSEGINLDEFFETPEQERDDSNINNQVGIEELENTIKKIEEKRRRVKEKKVSSNSDFTPNRFSCRKTFSGGLNENDKSFRPNTFRDGILIPEVNSEFYTKLEAWKTFKPERISPEDVQQPRARVPSKIKGSEKSYICEYCLREFEARYKLNLHARIHQGPTLFRCNCDKCGVPFRDDRTMSKYHRQASERN